MDKKKVEKYVDGAQWCNRIGTGDPHFRMNPCQITRHVGPHRAVREVEVIRDGADPVGKSRQSLEPHLGHLEKPPLALALNWAAW